MNMNAPVVNKLQETHIQIDSELLVNTIPLKYVLITNTQVVKYRSENDIRWDETLSYITLEELSALDRFFDEENDGEIFPLDFSTR